MDTANPYASPRSPSTTTNPTTKPRRSVFKRMFIGFSIGASIPALLGAYGIYQFNLYVASLPPGEFVCGNAVLGSWMLIVFVAPILGLVGATTAAVVP